MERNRLIKQSLRVLVVDDNPQDRRLVVRELRKAYPDSQVFEAIDEQQLVERIDEANFDIVITDYHLRWSDGIRVLQAVKQRLPSCPVIMFTGTGSEEIAVEAMKLGLDDYIIKNVKHLVRLRGAIQAVLQHATTKRQADQLASRMESLLSQLRVGVFSCTPQGEFLNLNAAMVELLNCVPGTDVYRMRLGELFSDNVAVESFLQAVVASQQPLETEIQVAGTAEDAKVYRLSARPVAADGESPRIDGMLEDVTRRKQSESDAKQSAVAAAQIEMLSPREQHVLHEVIAGHANKVIARHLDISDKTVEKHRASVMKKLRVRSVAELVRLALLAEGVAR